MVLLKLFQVNFGTGKDKSHQNREKDNYCQ